MQADSGRLQFFFSALSAQCCGLGMAIQPDPDPNRTGLGSIVKDSGVFLELVEDLGRV